MSDRIVVCVSNKCISTNTSLSTLLCPVFPLRIGLVQEEGEVADPHDAVAREERLHALQTRTPAEGAEHLGGVPAHATPHTPSPALPVAPRALARPRLHLGDGVQRRRQQLEAHLQQHRLRFTPPPSPTWMLLLPVQHATWFHAGFDSVGTFISKLPSSSSPIQRDSSAASAASGSGSSTTRLPLPPCT